MKAWQPTNSSKPRGPRAEMRMNPWGEVAQRANAMAGLKSQATAEDDEANGPMEPWAAGVNLERDTPVDVEVECSPEKQWHG